MKIGILTMPFNNNYGGYLQGFALQSALRDKGHEVTIINRRGIRHSTKYRVKLFVRGIIKSVLHFRRYPIFKVEASKGKLMQKFVRQMMTLSDPLYSSTELARYCEEQRFDAIVVGSDQIWRPEYVPNVEDYFLTFLGPETKRAAYAASFGISDPIYSDKLKRICGNGLKSFKYIGVRETSALDVFKKFGWDRERAVVNIDPTMLLPRQYYIDISRGYEKPKKYKGKIAAYILDVNTDIKKIADIAQGRLGIAIEYIMDPDRWKDESYVLPSIEEWLCAFAESEFILTDSFHGAVFSIIMHKEFIVYVNKARGRDRIETLLTTFGLMDRMVEDASDANINYLKPIDWMEVDKTIEYKRSQLDQLLDTLS